ncbi:MAG: alpha/beta hydrolase fold domain-containing protein [Luminiphilus sp.]|jgi:acetyl esterase|nr:alpha/beta hydrolase fold domain-containing protein [Luminiphilus sp.]MDG1461696.1 alpha/beta hydrolase fold domain-containing protein [Luminiphilus sp.]
MTYDPMQDDRLDMRNRGLLAGFEEPMLSQTADVTTREEALAAANTPEALAAEEVMSELLGMLDNEDVMPSKGLRITTESLVSHPDGNTINLQIIRPDTDEILPCVYYIHGGGMAILSALDPNYRAWGKTIAHQNLCVVMVDFRNSLRPSSVPEVAPYPAGLNDCVCGYKWVTQQQDALGIHGDKIMIAGESGGGNLAIATTMRLIAEDVSVRPVGLYALCPYILGAWPSEASPSSIENEGVLISVANNHPTMAYGIEAFEAEDPMAWPGFAAEADVADFPPTMISVNECDPLRDEGIAFYRLLQRAGVLSQCRQAMGTVHANEIFGAFMPDISRMTARDMAGWLKECSLPR